MSSPERATAGDDGALTDDLVAVVDSAPGRGTGLRGTAAYALTRAVDRIAPFIDRWVGAGARWSHLRPVPRVTVGWVVTRLVMFVLLALPEQTIMNDVFYYADNLATLSSGETLLTVLDEYPLPVVALLGLPWLVSFGSSTVYAVLFVAMMLAIDAAFLALLFRLGGHRQTTAVTLWLAAGPMMGPLAVTRFDLVPGVLAGAAVLLLATRPRLAAVFVVLGAAIKLWPAVLLPALAAPARTRWRVVVATLVSGIAVVAATVALGGVDRLLSPLTWQSDRGLQIESLPALPLMVAWAFVRDPWTVEFSRFITSQVSGPGEQLLIGLATLATAAALVLMAALWLRAWRRGSLIGAETVGWIMLTTTGLLILTNKVFSPQYLLWLSPVAIAMVAVAPRADTGVRRFVVLLLSVGILTQLIYPILYLWVSGVYWANPLGVALLAIRDLALIGFVVYAGRRAWRETAAPPAAS
jgi:hypothetical protein